MGRRVLGIILLIVAVCMVIGAVVLTMTPVGAQLLGNGSVPTTIVPAPVFVTRTPITLAAPKPVLTAQGNPPAVTASAYYLLDTDSGHVLADLDGEKPLPMASTTKIMTAIIAIQTADLDQVVTVRQDALDEVNLHNGSSAQLVVGDKMSLRNLLYALLLPSGDDAAVAIADAVSGSSGNFVNLMNLFAHRLHLYSTHFLDPDGLTVYQGNTVPDPDHYTTAFDLVRLSEYAMSIPLFAKIVQTQHFELPPSGLHHGYTWDTTNTLLSSYNGMTGIKTGFTVEAGGCLVFSATRKGHHLLGALLHSIDQDHRFSDARALLDWAFALPLSPAK